MSNIDDDVWCSCHEPVRPALSVARPSSYQTTREASKMAAAGGHPYRSMETTEKPVLTEGEEYLMRIGMLHLAHPRKVGGTR